MTITEACRLLLYFADSESNSR